MRSLLTLCLCLATVSLAFGQASFEPQGPTCSYAFPVGCAAGGDPEGVAHNGIGLATVDNSCNGSGFPGEGAQYGRIVAEGPVSAPPGGPYPGGGNELYIPVGPGGWTLYWEFYNAEGGPSSSFNDGASIDLLDAACMPLMNLVYADTNTPLGSAFDGGGCGGGGTEIAPAGPQSLMIPAMSGAAYVRIACWNGGDNAVSSVVCADLFAPGANQLNTGAAGLDFTGAPCKCTFPRILENNQGGDTFMTISSAANGSQPYALVATVGVPATAGPGTPTPFGLLDLDFPTVVGGGMTVVIDGLAPLTPLDMFLGTTGAGGSRTIEFNLPSTGTGTWATFQGAVVDPGAASGLTLTGATQIDFPTDTPPATIGTTPTGNGDDTSFNVVFSMGLTVPFFGTTYSDVYVNSNGNLTFTAADGDFTESEVEFLTEEPRIAPLWDDLSPNNGGANDYTETGSTFVASWVGVPEFFSTGSNNLSVLIDSAGGIFFEYGSVSAADGIVGISPGGTATGASMDLSANLSYVGAAGEAIFESFVDPTNVFDLDAGVLCGSGLGFLTFIPNPPTTTPGDTGYAMF